MAYSMYFADLTHTGAGVNADMFPLGIGLVAAYAHEYFKGGIEVSIFKYPEKLNNELSHKLPDIMCFSNYAWNSNLANVFATYVKQCNPKTIIIFGGPNFPLEPDKRKAYLCSHAEIDFYIKWDGEYALTRLVKRLMEMGLDVKSFKESHIILENVCYVYKGDYIEGEDQRVMDIDSIPSPYTMGLFDKFFDGTLIPLFETTRGCPYTCTFCNDGSSHRKIARKFSKKIKEEMVYTAKRVEKPAMFLSDLNFGMYKEDIETAKIIASIIKEYNWPERFETSTGKSNPELLIETNRIINSVKPGVFKLGYSFQSTNPEVLKKIKRRNLSLEQLKTMRNYRHEKTVEHLEFFTELILALPGDSINKFTYSLRDVIDELGANNIDVHQLTILEGSELATKAQRKKYKMETKYRVFVGCFGLYCIGKKWVPCAEIEEVVIGNNTLSFEEYIDARILHLLVKIYIDHDPFGEVFSYVRELGLSVIDVIVDLKENIIKRYRPIVELIENYVEGIKKPLFETYEDVQLFISDVDVIKKYLSSDYGQNELLTHRVLAYNNCNIEVHSALKNAVLFNLKKNNALNRFAKEYVTQAIEYCRLKRFNLDGYKERKVGVFTFDFIRAAEDGHKIKIDPKEIMTEERQYCFYYEDKDLEEIEKLIELWGTDTPRQIGKMYQRNNLMRMSRKVCILK